MTERIDTVRLREIATRHADLTDPADPYPAELVGELSRGVLQLLADDDKMGRYCIEQHAEYEQRRNAQHEAYERQRWATVAWLLDRAEQYDNSSGYRALFDELVQDIAEWRHVQLADAGEYDDMKKRVDRILARRSA